MTSPFIMQWENISVTVTERRYSIFRAIKKKKTILKNVSGFATSNSLIAVLGPSGSGKTTFLGAISGKIREKEGILKINNRTATDKEIRNISGYTYQDDVFTESLTAYEHMKFMAAMKLHKTREERNEIIKKLLIELCLDESSHTIVRMLSGGQRRRLSLATELLSDPYILFCDEPTTGLDSFSALTVVKILEAAAVTGKLVLVTLHQPSSHIFDLFNNIILLANGKLIFQGSNEGAKLFFEKANLYCPVSYNPADFYMKCVTTSFEVDDQSKKVDFLSDLFQNNCEAPNDISKDNNPLGCFKQKAKRNSFFVQLSWLAWRIFIETKRSLYIYRTNYSCTMVTAFIIAATFSNVEIEDKSSPQNVLGALSLMVSELVFSHMYHVIYVFPAEVVIFSREKALYSAFPYYISKVVSLIPQCFITSFSFLGVYFIFLHFLQSFTLYFSMSVVMFFTSLCGTALGFCLSALFPTIEYVHLFIMPIEVIAMSLSGIFIKIDTLPKLVNVLKYLSPFYYGFQAVSTLCWEKVEFLANCTSVDEVPCYKNGKDVLQQYGIYKEYDVVTYNILCLFIITVVYCAIGYIGILRKRAVFESY